MGRDDSFFLVRGCDAKSHRVFTRPILVCISTLDIIVCGVICVYTRVRSDCTN